MGLMVFLSRMFGYQSRHDHTAMFTILIIITHVLVLFEFYTESMFTCKGHERSWSLFDVNTIIYNIAALAVITSTNLCGDRTFTLCMHVLHLIGVFWTAFVAGERLQCMSRVSELKKAKSILKGCFSNPTNCHSDYLFRHEVTIWISQTVAAVFFIFILMMHCKRNPRIPRIRHLEVMSDHDPDPADNRERQQRRRSNDEIELGQIRVDVDPNPPVQDPRFLQVPSRHVQSRQPLRQVRGDDHLNSPRRRPRQVAPVDFHRAHDS